MSLTDFAKLSLCIREETSLWVGWGGGGERFKGSLVGVVLLKSFDSDPV